MSEYLKQATDFLTKTNSELVVEFVKHDKHFTDDKEKRDIYKVTLKRGNRQYTFNFGQSINESCEYKVASNLVKSLWNEKLTGGNYGLTEKEYKRIKGVDYINHVRSKDIFKNTNFAVPNAYDVLTCLQKYEVGTFENFCGDFGYDVDSPNAEKTYNAVKDEYTQLAMLYSDKELEEMQKIQ